MTDISKKKENVRTHLKDLSVGTMELVKKFPGYKKALDKLKEDYKKQNESIQTKNTV